MQQTLDGFIRISIYNKAFKYFKESSAIDLFHWERKNDCIEVALHWSLCYL